YSRTEESGAKLPVEIVNPEAGDGALAEEIAANYGFQPQVASLFDLNTFYFYLTLTDGQTLVQIPIPDALSEEAARRGIEEGLKRFAAGLLRTVALVAPTAPPPYMAGQGMGGNQFSQLQGTLANDFNVETTDLAEGVVPEAADVLMVVDPSDLSEKQLFAVDQFLMKGGTVVIAAGAFEASLTGQSLTATRRTTGLEGWLEHQGIGIGESLVMDPVNAAFPVPVTRRVGGFSFQELVMLDYPYFPDIRAPGLSQDSLITSALPQVTMAWASPIEIDGERNAGREVTELLRTSAGSWLSTSNDVMPRVNEAGLSAFVPEGDPASQLVGVAISGRFESFFKDRDSPLLEVPEDEAEGEEETDANEAGDTDETSEEEDTLGIVSSVIERSPESARLFVFPSNGFLADQTLRMVGSADGTLYDNSVQMLVNAVDWSLEDRTLLGIRARGNFNRTLPGDWSTDQQSRLEYINYGLALAGIGLVYLLHRQLKARRRRIYRGWLAGEVA
ncbi:MAG: Gldg family protein, partial [Gammaproteobacteria bacterium]|nr:Gldg family protein [Gammaproteobacteria bacterium]